MVSKLDKLVVNRRGVSDLLRSPQVAAELKRRADAIAAAADSNTGRASDHRVEVQIGRTRARAAVITDTFNAMHREADQRTLTRAIDAGRR